MEALDLLTGWILFASLALATGALVMRWVILSRPPMAPSEGAIGDAAHVGARSTVALIAALALVFVRQLLEFHDPFNSWTGDARVLLVGTSWGTIWGVAVVVAVLTVAAFVLARRGRGGTWAAATVGVLSLGAFPGLTGHANSGDLRALTLAADILHVWAMGAWIGTLGLILMFERRHRRSNGAGQAASLLPVFVPRFSPVAMGSVVTLVTTGTLAAWVHLDGLSALLTTGYGRLLLLKVALVGGVLALGAWNWRRLTPLLSEASGQHGMRRAATLEFVLANVVLLITALLVRTSPM